MKLLTNNDRSILISITMEINLIQLNYSKEKKVIFEKNNSIKIKYGAFLLLMPYFFYFLTTYFNSKPLFPIFHSRKFLSF